MPIYEFETPDGEVIELFYRMADAPGWGEVIDHKGLPVTRILERHQILGRREMRVTAQSLKRQAHWNTEELRVHREAGGTFDKRGQPQFSTRKQIDEHVKVANDTNVHGKTLSFGDV